MESIEPPPVLVHFDSLLLSGFNFTLGFEFILLMFLLIASALISGSEAAFFSITPSDRDELSSSSDKKSLTVSKMLDRPQELLATILVSNNFVNVAIVILSNAILKTTIPKGSLTDGWRLFVEVVLITFVLLLFGEVLPKIYATKNALKFAKFMAQPLDILRKLPPYLGLRKF